MKFEELEQRLLALPGATRDWLVYALSDAGSGPPIPTGYSLVRRDATRFEVYKGDGRGGSSIAKDDDGETPLVFATEDAACQWIWDEVQWWREYEARKRRSHGGTPGADES